MKVTKRWNLKTPYVAKTTGDFIFLARKRARMSRIKLANILDMDPKAIYYWEHDRSLPTVNTLVNLSIVLNTSVRMLLTPMYEDRERRERLQKRREWWTRKRKYC